MNTPVVLLLILANEAMTFATIIIVFPGFLPPKDPLEWMQMSMMFIAMSFAWPLFLALFPLVYCMLWCVGDLKQHNPYFKQWPFRRDPQ